MFYSGVKRKCDIDDLGVYLRIMLGLFSNKIYYFMLNRLSKILKANSFRFHGVFGSVQNFRKAVLFYSILF